MSSARASFTRASSKHFKQGLNLAIKKALLRVLFSWLRELDLNQRPSGYEYDFGAFLQVSMLLCVTLNYPVYRGFGDC